jgi:hypothetical protein
MERNFDFQPSDALYSENLVNQGKLFAMDLVFQGRALRWANCWAFGPNDCRRFCVELYPIFLSRIFLSVPLFSPTRFVPQQDKGYLVLNVQLPDSASVQRTEQIMGRIEALARATPGVDHTVGISGQSLIATANAPNLGSMYVMASFPWLWPKGPAPKCGGPWAWPSSRACSA